MNLTFFRHCWAPIIRRTPLGAASRLDWCVLNAIASRCDNKTLRCRTSQRIIARVAGCSQRSANRSISWWKASGLLKVTRTGRASVYAIGNFRDLGAKEG